MINLLRKTYFLLRPFGRDRANLPALGILLTILAMIFFIVKIQVKLNDWNNDFFNALSEINRDKLWHLVLLFPLILALYVVLAVNKKWLIKLLIIRWRRWLTDYYTSRWLANKRYYYAQLTTEHAEVDNPDQRIAEDIALFIQKILSLTLGFIQSLSTLLTFSIILWQSAGTLRFSLAGYSIELHGYMVYAVILLVILGTIFTHKVGQRIRQLNVERQRKEANFRTHLIRNNEHAEIIALSRAEVEQKSRFNLDFSLITENWHALMNAQRRLDYWQSIYSRSLGVIPYFLLLPQFISGQISLGGLMKTKQAFMLVSNNLSWFIYKYDALAELASVIDRLYQFHQLTDPREADTRTTTAPHVRLEDATILAPGGTPLLSHLNFSVNTGEWLLLRGRSGIGKTTLLRALCHSWPFTQGHIAAPQRSCYLAQHGYMDGETLYAWLHSGLEQEKWPDRPILEALLQRVGLARLCPVLEHTGGWINTLSSGEKQRLNLARLLLRRPEWIFMDEATSHLAEDEALTLLNLIKTELPEAGVILVTHQRNLWLLANKIYDLS